MPEAVRESRVKLTRGLSGEVGLSAVHRMPVPDGVTTTYEVWVKPENQKAPAWLGREGSLMS